MPKSKQESQKAFTLDTIHAQEKEKKAKAMHPRNANPCPSKKKDGVRTRGVEALSTDKLNLGNLGVVVDRRVDMTSPLGVGGYTRCTTLIAKTRCVGSSSE